MDEYMSAIVAGKGEFDWLNTPVSPWIYYFYSVRIT
jgi:hypothetical protein